ncbi:2'-5' RNA ligase [Sphingobium amiense]|uniref:2'-5' RNA ligase n=1 Tax=Sphingobium amiense TaxID=135719 RepID=A0A494W636_9SPHN|nr:2'-5' RNA ligase family protein [Sphingobium amiense]BBE00044.1 2'-5' RNA ligase [Sphingobium amiense]
MEARAVTLYRPFFALRPPPQVARQIDHFARTLDPAADHILTAHQHVTIGITTDAPVYPYELVKALRRAAAGICAAPFDLMLDRLSIGGRSAALRPSGAISGLSALRQEVDRAMRAAGALPRPGWTFSPHQTLFYRHSRPEQRTISGFGWRVEELALICSHVGQTRHEVIGRWPLIGDRQYRLL